MNKIRQIQELNKKELEQGVSPQASWHTDYRDTAFVYFGGLPFELSEGDVISIFSQYGEPVFLKLARDRETGKSKGFGWLKYEDQRSTDLAVDNLGGASISGRLIHVDHARYKARDDEDLAEYKVGWEDIRRREGFADTNAGGDSETDGAGGQYDTESDGGKRQQRHRRQVEKEERPVLPEERELERLIQDHDDEDPMKEYLIEEKKKEVEAALQRIKGGDGDESKARHHRHRSHKSHRSHRSHRSRRDDEMDVENEDRERSPRKLSRHESEADDRRERHHRRGERDARERGERDRDRDWEKDRDRDWDRYRDRDRGTERERRLDDRVGADTRDGRREHRDRHSRRREKDGDEENK